VFHDRGDFVRDGRDFFNFNFFKNNFKNNTSQNLFAPQDSFAHTGLRGAAG
jgi:hypothetical protein